MLFRDTTTGDPLIFGTPATTFDSLNFQWELAFRQGLLRRADGDNLVDVFLFYRGRWDTYINDEPLTAFADMRGLIGTSFMAGASYDSRAISLHRQMSGAYAEVSAEWGPGFLNAHSDFWRVSAQVRSFLPLFDLPRAGGNLFNAYLGEFIGVDYADGYSVPIYVNQSFGGVTLRESLGDCVRGYERSSYDTAFKAVSNTELRLVGPALGTADIVPILYAFVDCGVSYGLNGATTSADTTGILSSVGGGVAVDLFGIVQVGFVAGMKLANGWYSPLHPLSFWGLSFFMHF